jgi:salicylate hydroxylase
MTLSTSKIAVVGGGLGGMSFMNAALYAGLENIDLYEQAPEFKEVGAGVNITRNANRVLEAYGLSDKMLWKSSRNPPCYMEYRNCQTGDYIGQIDEFGDPRSRQIHRAHLLDVLKERVPLSKIHTGRKLARIETRSTGTRYVLHFENGTTAEADIVVGCDGIKSKVREHLGFTDTPLYSGQTVYRGYVAYEDLPPDTAAILRRTVIFRGNQKHILTLPVGNDESKTARVGIIGFMTESLDSWSSESWMSRAPIDDFQEHIKDWAEPCQHIVAGLRKDVTDDQMLKQALYVREPIEKWYKVDDEKHSCGIVLLGDSAHSTLPHQGKQPNHEIGCIKG